MDDFNRQFSEQQSFDMHEISPNKPQKTKSRFGVGFVVGIAVGIAIAMAGLVVYGLITYKRVMEITSGQTAYSYDSYEDKVNSILQYLDAYYDGEIDEQAVEDSIASGVLNGIGDRYAKYYSKEEFQRMMEDSSGEYSGVGISVILDDDGKIVVYKVFPGTPAEEAGVHAMDEQGNGDGKHVGHSEQRIGDQSDGRCDVACRKGDNKIDDVEEDSDVQHEAERPFGLWLGLFRAVVMVVMMLVLFSFFLFHSIFSKILTAKLRNLLQFCAINAGVFTHQRFEGAKRTDGCDVWGR